VAIEAGIWIYWLFCLIALIVVIQNRSAAQELLSTEAVTLRNSREYFLFLTLGWLTTLLAGVGYVLLTHKYDEGNYRFTDLIAFSFVNGALEQFMFIFWFLLGCYVGKLKVPDSPRLIFVFGYLGYAIFSGLIHAYFWIRVLPSHEPALIMPFALAAMSLSWMWLIWRYQAVIAIIAMHVTIDFITVGHLNFPWFEVLN
jgi:chlorophyllide a hydrolase